MIDPDTVADVITSAKLQIPAQARTVTIELKTLKHLLHASYQAGRSEGVKVEREACARHVAYFASVLRDRTGDL